MLSCEKRVFNDDADIISVSPPTQNKNKKQNITVVEIGKCIQYKDQLYFIHMIIVMGTPFQH